MMTSSPLSTVATSALNSVCLPPTLTEIWSGLKSRPVVAAELAADRFLQRHRAVTSVYLVWPARIASIAASLTKSGCRKSGSPALQLITSTPAAFSADTRAVIASVADGWMRLRAAETWGFSDMTILSPWLARTGGDLTGNCAGPRLKPPPRLRKRSVG